MNRGKGTRFKFGVAVMTMGAVTSICLVPVGGPPPRAPKGGPAASAVLKSRGGGGEIPFQLPILLVAHDGSLELYDAPGGALLETLDKEALFAQVVGGQTVGGYHWYRLQLEADGSTAWVIANEVTIESESAVRFFDFRFAPGSAANPGNGWGNPIPLSGEGIWASWRYQGLQAGDQVQWLLVVNGEQYAVPLDVWGGAPAGSRLVNLLGANPRVEPGLWTVKIFVNGEFITEGSVTVQ